MGNVVKSRKVKPRAAFKTGKVGKVWKERGKVSKEELASKGESIKAVSKEELASGCLYVQRVLFARLYTHS